MKEDILKAIADCETVVGTKKLTQMVDEYEKSGADCADVTELRNIICDLTFNLYFKERAAGKYEMPKRPVKVNKVIRLKPAKKESKTKKK